MKDGVSTVTSEIRAGEETEVIRDPEVYWGMATYSLRLDRVLAELRHLYEPPDALRWVTAGQAMLGNRVPADLITTPEGLDEVLAMLARINEGAFS